MNPTSALIKNNRLLFVDDHPLVLSSLAEMLGNGGFAVSTAKTLMDAKRLILESAPFDVVLLDINLGIDSGLQVLKMFSKSYATKVVLFSGITEQEWILQGMSMGAIGFIPKSIEIDELLLALQTLIFKQQKPLTGWVWDTGAKKLVDAHDFFPKHSILTPKEREVFMLLRRGRLDKQIADELGLSIHTVRVHLRAIRRKRGHNRRLEQTF